MKQFIKKLAQEQKCLKANRKTVKFDCKKYGHRILPANDAAQKVRGYKWELRHLYIAYGISRGKTFEQIESKGKKEDIDWKYIDKILEKFKTETVA